MLPLRFSSDRRFAFFDFQRNGRIIENAPECGMTLRAAGSMRFRWNETNSLRDEVLKEISSSAVTPVELIHSKIVQNVTEAGQTRNVQADGIITKNKELMPVVTVADCMPVFLYEPESKIFGIVHSGWKGTGIAAEAIRLAEKDYGAKAENFCVILGPHIRDCCYIVNQERAEYFAKEFTPECVRKLEAGGTCYAGGRGLPVVWNNGGGQLYRLSLEKANLAVLKKTGVPAENINVIEECTCCNEIFGSNRRETAIWEAGCSLNEAVKTVASTASAGCTAAAHMGSMAPAQHFTVQAAFIHW